VGIMDRVYQIHLIIQLFSYRYERRRILPTF